jgi:hypothetical protein
VEFVRSSAHGRLGKGGFFVFAFLWEYGILALQAWRDGKGYFWLVRTLAFGMHIVIPLFLIISGLLRF